jgi:hypothetical protein
MDSLVLAKSSKHISSPRFLSSSTSYDVTSTVHQSLAEGANGAARLQGGAVQVDTIKTQVETAYSLFFSA